MASVQFTPLYGVHSVDPCCYLLEVDEATILLDCRCYHCCCWKSKHKKKKIFDGELAFNDEDLQKEADEILYNKIIQKEREHISNQNKHHRGHSNNVTNNGVGVENRRKKNKRPKRLQSRNQVLSRSPRKTKITSNNHNQRLRAKQRREQNLKKRAAHLKTKGNSHQFNNSRRNSYVHSNLSVQKKPLRRGSSFISHSRHNTAKKHHHHHKA